MQTTSKVATFGAAAGIVAGLLIFSGWFSPVFAASSQTPAATASTSATSTTTTTVTTNTTSTVSSAIPTLSVGQTVTINSTAGHYRVVGDKSENGTASGSITFTVTGKFAEGYTLSITSGVLNVNGTSYGIASGSSETGPYAHHMVGQGAAVGPTASTSGAFLMRATARGSFGGEYATMSLDLQTGKTEYVISLVGTIQS